jgi:intracellular sulfur oxidation DsrE/DsrF family protein
MKNSLVLLIASVWFYTLSAQNVELIKGPIINDFGASFQIETVDLQLNTNKEYKVIFDVFTDNSKDGKENPLIGTVARYLNMHAQQGVKLENMKVALILHGKATKSALSNSAFNRIYNTENPNIELIDALKKANVEIFVCAQSYLFSKYDLKDVSENVKVSLSALTALVEYQSNGYQIINFN